MAKYMVIWDLPSDKRNEAIARFVEGSALEEPEGVSLVSRWHSVAGGRGWSTAEIDFARGGSAWATGSSASLEFARPPSGGLLAVRARSFPLPQPQSVTVLVDGEVVGLWIFRL